MNVLNSNRIIPYYTLDNTKLPYEVVEYFFSFVGFKDLFSTSLVCKGFRAISVKAMNQHKIRQIDIFILQLSQSLDNPVIKQGVQALVGTIARHFINSGSFFDAVKSSLKVELMVYRALSTVHNVHHRDRLQVIDSINITIDQKDIKLVLFERMQVDLNNKDSLFMQEEMGYFKQTALEMVKRHWIEEVLLIIEACPRFHYTMIGAEKLDSSDSDFKIKLYQIAFDQLIQLNQLDLAFQLTKRMLIFDPTNMNMSKIAESCDENLKTIFQVIKNKDIQIEICSLFSDKSHRIINSWRLIKSLVDAEFYEQALNVATWVDIFFINQNNSETVQENQTQDPNEAMLEAALGVEYTAHFKIHDNFDVDAFLNVIEAIKTMVDYFKLHNQKAKAWQAAKAIPDKSERAKILATFDRSIYKEILLS